MRKGLFNIKLSKHTSWLVGIILVAFLLRIINLSKFPVGFTPDEASFGYDAYSLLKTGEDQWGDSWPISFRSFGDFKLPVYTYLAIPSVAIFGLNELAVRLPSAVIGTLAVLATYLMVSVLFNKKKNESSVSNHSSYRNYASSVAGGHSLAILAALLLAISPWHVSLSRGAFEANLTAFFMPLGVWIYFKGIEKQEWLCLSALLFGINLFTYHSARLVTPILVVFLVVLTRKELGYKRLLSIPKLIRRYLLSISVFSLFILLALFTVFSGGGSRASDITIFNPTDKWVGLFERRYEAVFEGLPNSVARFFNNKQLYVVDRFINNYSTYFSPQFLFTQGPSEWTYGMIPGRGVVYLIELPFMLATLWFVTRRGFGKSRALTLILGWVLLAPLPAALTKGEGFAGNRVAVMMPAIQVLSAYGALVIYDLIINKWREKLVKPVLFSGFIVLLLISLIFFLEDYRYHAPRGGAAGMLYGRQEAVEFVSMIEEQYSEIVFSRSLSEPQIFVAFYKKWDPEDFQKKSQDWLRYEGKDLLFVDQLGEYHLGKYSFRNISFNEDRKAQGTLLVGKVEEFPHEVVTLKTILYPNQDPAILIVDPSKVSYAKAF